jgi:hypothetical protein
MEGQSGCCGKTEKSMSQPVIEPRLLCHVACGLVIILTELFRIQLRTLLDRLDRSCEFEGLVSLKEVCCVGQTGGGERERPLMLLDAISAVAVAGTTRNVV